MPDASSLRPQMHIEFQTRSSTVSGTTVRSISVEHPTPPEKFVRYKARYELEADLEYVFGEQAAQFIARNSAPAAAPAASAPAAHATHAGPQQQIQQQQQVAAALPSLFPDLNRAVQVFNAEPGMGGQGALLESAPYEQTQSLVTNPFLSLVSDESAGVGESATGPGPGPGPGPAEADPVLTQAKDIFFGARTYTLRYLIFDERNRSVRLSESCSLFSITVHYTVHRILLC